MANKSGAGRDSQLTNYKNNKTWERNRTRRLTKLLTLQPNNSQIGEALKNIRYRRKTPTTPVWSSSRKYEAYLYKYFSGSVNLEIFSKNEKAAISAQLGHRMKWDFKPLPFSEKSMFALGTRAHTRGNQWA